MRAWDRRAGVTLVIRDPNATRVVGSCSAGGRTDRGDREGGEDADRFMPVPLSTAFRKNRGASKQVAWNLELCVIYSIKICSPWAAKGRLGECLSYWHRLKTLDVRRSFGGRIAVHMFDFTCF